MFKLFYHATSIIESASPPATVITGGLIRIINPLDYIRILGVDFVIIYYSEGDCSPPDLLSSTAFTAAITLSGSKGLRI